MIDKAAGAANPSTTAAGGSQSAPATSVTQPPVKPRRSWPGRLVRAFFIFVCVYGLAALVAPFITADRFGDRLQNSLERALGRKVEFKVPVTLSMFPGPSFLVACKDCSAAVVIHEDPSISLEPMAYVRSLKVRPSLWRLLFTGKFVIASISLDDATINLGKTGKASEVGRWNFGSFVDRTVMRNLPAIHVRDGRINFRFGDEKSVFYLTNADLDISPPVSIGSGWDVKCSAQPARSDRAGFGLGQFNVSGRWFVEPERIDINLEVSDTGLGDLTSLIRGEAGGIHGEISARLHLAGPIDNVGISGRLRLDDVHRWDLLPSKSSGWPLDIRGRLNVPDTQLELESNSVRDVQLPLLLRYRVTNYLSQPRWALAVNWNRFPAAPLLQLARDMGVQAPADLRVAGTLDGAITYSGEGSYQGMVGFHDAAVTIPGSPPVTCDIAYFVMDNGHVRLSPATAHMGSDQAFVEGDYSIADRALALQIVTDSMQVASLRAQVSLAAVPWLDQVQAGKWNGTLRYQWTPAASNWTGDLDLHDGQMAAPGLADPLHLNAAHARIDGADVTLDHIDAQAGKVAFTGDYSYVPGAARPHKVKLHADAVDMADLEAELTPTLRHDPGLIARALGRSALPAWLEGRGVEGTVDIADATIGDVHLTGFRSRLLWDAARVELDGVQARLNGATLTGRLAVNLRGSRPAYRWTGRMKGWSWQGGTLDSEGTVDTSGAGSQLLSNLKAEGTFSGSDLDLGSPAPWRCNSGDYRLSVSSAGPHLQLTGLTLRTADETYAGQGGTQDGARLLVTLSSGAKEVRLSGTLSKLKIEE